MESEASQDWIAEYLASHPEYTSAAPLAGGVSNYLYRLTRADGSSVVLKHAEPHAAFDENWAMDMARMKHEHAALSSIAEALSSSAPAHAAAVEMPRVITYDADKYNLVLSDCGTATKDLYTAFPSLAPAQRVDTGRRLGLWLAALHQCTAIDKTAFAADESRDRQGMDQRIGLLSAGLPAADAADERAAEEKVAFAALLEPFVVAALRPSRRCVVHGDFWPGNILVGPSQEEGGGGRHDDLLAVIDWEGVGLGTGALDVGAMAAEAWLLCHFHRVSARASVVEPDDFGMFEAFLGSYLEAAAAGQVVDEAFVEQAVVQFAVNLSVGRGGKELMRPVKGLGCRIVELVMGREEEEWKRGVLDLGWGMEAWRDWFAGPR